MLRDGRVCESCLGPGREWNCLRYNCEGSLFKSFGYALRGINARYRGVAGDVADVYIVLSEFQRNWFELHGIAAEKLAVVPNMLPDGADGVKASGEVIGFLGRIAAEKGFDDFREAARRLPHLRFEAAGEIKAGYAPGDLPPNLKLRGFLSGNQLDKFIESLQMLTVCSKWYEGFPNTITRAMAAGLPVVAADIGAIPEVVENGVTGLLYDPGDVDGLAGSISRLAEDARLRRRLGDDGCRKAREEYAPQVVCRKLMQALEGAKAQRLKGMEP